ncbi:MAG TPA: hypothetical protein VF939_09340 [Puia sp.]
MKKTTQTTLAAGEPKSRDEPMSALELAYQQGQQALIKEQDRELLLRRFFFSSYIALALALVGWSIYFYHLYKIKMRLSPKTDISSQNFGK